MVKNNISEEENIVLGVIQEFLDQNRPFDPPKIISYLKNRFSRSSININDQGIKEILNSLIKNYYIVNGSKLTKTKVLINDNRKRIFEIIKKNPGIYFSKLVEKTKLANHVVSWHINVLIKFNCIKKDSIENHEIYYFSSVTPIEGKNCYYLSKKKSKQILAFFKRCNYEGCTKSRLSRELKTHYNIISNYVEKLEEIGILRKVELTNNTIYYINQENSNLIEKINLE